MSQATRREFLASATVAGAAMALGSRSAKAGPNERVNLCVIGVRGRGSSVGKGFAGLPEAQVTHVCDVNELLLDGYAKQIAEVQKTTPKTVQDLRRVLDDKSVDAIVVTTPDHWHALATIWGCQAGKHVYVEKPISNNIFEGRQMVAAARKHNRVVQVGTQSRSAPHYGEMIKILRSGRLGHVHMAKAWNSQLRRRVPAVPDSAVPAGLDWNIWQGPAPEHAFNANRFSYGWRWLWDYGTGDMGNDGVHDLDIARWGLDVDFPTEIQCTGDKLAFAGDSQETPDTQFVTFRFPQKEAVLVYEQRLWSPYFQEGYENGVAFYGTEGYLLAGRAGWKLVEKRNKVVEEKSAQFSDIPHFKNFLNGIRSGEALNCDIEEGYRSTLLAHLGNLAYRVGRPLKFDAKTQSIVGDDEANALTKRLGRKEFLIPEVI
ncbi:Gfo/Idh/MocA family protein [Schlesneria paludicola]|uniref:Gfo/Idh/MocA family protein n=1 Tax=Schlesneria paludicola TaxID=360056 RepID=UPI00029A8C3B|nr:Gfo/Idh/MocA family oxidoreductase [Schlesneria paludicola]